MNTKVAKVRRPAIPLQTQCELWGRAAGRCEFRGCNEPVYRDSLTQKRSNLANISHIVAFSPDGPRGDPNRSAMLATDICNLMLTCKVHAKVVDDTDKVDDYPEALLLEFKQEHERRIQLLTASKEDAQTHVVLLQAPIDGEFVSINHKEVFDAILPAYPTEEQPTVINLSGLAVEADAPGFFPLLATSITKQISKLLEHRPSQSYVKKFSIFALAPIPLLIHFGTLLGEMLDIDLYQRHRTSPYWRWRAEEENTQNFYEVIKPLHGLTANQPLALLLSVSEPVNRDRVMATLRDNCQIIELRATNPGRDFLRSRERLQNFGVMLRHLLRELRDTQAHNEPIHVFAAVPAPLAIEFGRNIKAFDAPFCIYEYYKKTRCFQVGLTVNQRE